MKMTEIVNHPSVRELQQSLLLTPADTVEFLHAQASYTLAVWLQEIALQLSELTALMKVELGVETDLSQSCGVRQ